MKFKEVETRGKFRFPSQSEDASGTLTISNDGIIKLDIDEIRLDIDEFQLGNDPVRQIIGEIEGGQFAIFEDCIPTHSKRSFIASNTGFLWKREFRATHAFIGFPKSLENIPRFNTLKFSIEGIDQWINISGIERGYDPKKMVFEIKYALPETISFNIEDNMEISVVFGANMNPSPDLSQIKLVQKVYFQLKSPIPQNIEDFISVAEKVRKLLCFVMNKYVSFDSMSGASDLDGVDSAGPVEIYGPGIYTSKTPINSSHILFMFSNDQRDPSDAIRNWVGNYKEYKVAFDLYFNAQTIQQPNLKFLLLAQGIEVFHQIRYGKPAGSRYIYKHRILDMLKDSFVTSGGTLQLVNDETTSKLVNALKANDDYMRNFTDESSLKSELDMAIYYLMCYIRDTRNYLTHYNEDYEPPKSASGIGLYYLCRKLEMLLELHFLRLLEFSDEEVRRVLTKLSWKRDFPLNVTQ